MIITTNITMDLSRRGPTQVISAVQDDRYSRNIAMALTCGGVAWEPPEGTTAQIRYRTAGGTGGNYDALPDGTPAWAIDGNILTIALAPQVCTVPGKTALTVALLQEDVQLHTFAVTVDVQPNPGLEYTSGNYFKISGALTSPEGARVGQYLRVSAVDEKGNVTAVETVDINADMPVAYLYNGNELPPVLEHEYPNTILYREDNGAVVLKAFRNYSWVSGMGDGGILLPAGHATCVLTDGEWGDFRTNQFTGDTILYKTETYSGTDAVEFIWANINLLFSDGSLFMEATDPVPVYHENESSGGGMPEYTMTTDFNSGTGMLSEEDSAALMEMGRNRTPFIMHSDSFPIDAVVNVSYGGAMTNGVIEQPESQGFFLVSVEGFAMIIGLSVKEGEQGTYSVTMVGGM